MNNSRRPTASIIARRCLIPICLLGCGGTDAAGPASSAGSSSTGGVVATLSSATSGTVSSRGGTSSSTAGSTRNSAGASQTTGGASSAQGGASATVSHTLSPSGGTSPWSGGAANSGTTTSQATGGVLSATAGASSGRGGTATSGTSNAAACPAQAPLASSPCARTGLECIYQNCSTTGITVAVCQGTWSVTSNPCPTEVQCSLMASTNGCSPNQICLTLAGGALMESCIDNTCGEGPIDCSCLPSCSGVCSLYAYSTGLALMCNTCPQGGCP